MVFKIFIFLKESYKFKTVETKTYINLKMEIPLKIYPYISPNYI